MNEQLASNAVSVDNSVVGPRTNEQVYAEFDSLWDDARRAESFVTRRPLLAHYTTIQTLDRMLAGDEIWFSNPLFMNDLHELRWGIIEGETALRENATLRDACGTPARHSRLLLEFGSEQPLERGPVSKLANKLPAIGDDLGGSIERRFLADSASSTKPPEADIREDWDELANGHNGRGRVSRAPN